MKKKKVIALALALSLSAVPGINSVVPFVPVSESVTVSAASVAAVGEYRVTTSTDPLSFRKGPSTSSTRIDLIPKGTLIKSNGTVSGNWLKVYYGGQWGWVSRTYVKYYSNTNRTGYYSVNTRTDPLALRPTPSTSLNALYWMPKGSRVYSDGALNNGWLHVRYNGKWGWASKSYLR